MTNSPIIIPGVCTKEAQIQTASALISVANSPHIGNVVLECSGLVIALCGGASVPEGRSTWNEVTEMTRLISARGGIIVNDGEDSGIMLASAKQSPETTLGILTPHTKPNTYGVKTMVEHRMTRHAILAKLPAVVVFEGGVGTIGEWALALREIKDAFNDGRPLPIVYLHEYWKEPFDALWSIRAIPKRVMDQVKFFAHAREVVDAMVNATDRN